MGSQQARRIAAVLIAASLALLAGCTGSSSDAPGDAAPKSSSTPAQLAPEPGRRRGRRRPEHPVQVSVTNGELGDVTVADSAGAEVPAA